MNVAEWPLELIDQILKHLDAISLAKSRQVCRSWRALHSQPKYKFVWRAACFRDIGKDVLIELRGDRAVSGDQHPNDIGSIDSIDWEDVYKEWYRSRHVGKWPCMITELKGHKGPVWDVKFSGDRMVTCGQDGTIRVWDSWTSHCVTTVLAHRDAVCSIALRKRTGALPHADTLHDLLVSGSRDRSVKVWEMTTPHHLLASLVTLHGHTACINCVAIDSNLAASASDDCSVRVWDISTGHCRHLLSNLSSWVKFVRLSHQELLLYVSDNNQLGLWSVHDKKLLSSVALENVTADNSLPVTMPGVLGAVLRGQTAVVLTQCYGLFVWEQKLDCSIVHNFSLVGHHTNSVQRGECLAMRGALVAIGTRSGAVYIYHLDGKWKNQFSKVHCLLHVSQSPVNAVALDDDGEGPALAIAGEDGMARVYRWFPPRT